MASVCAMLNKTVRAKIHVKYENGGEDIVHRRNTFVEYYYTLGIYDSQSKCSTKLPNFRGAEGVKCTNDSKKKKQNNPKKNTENKNNTKFYNLYAEPTADFLFYGHAHVVVVRSEEKKMV